MKCMECGGKMKTAQENFRHEALGLPLTLLGTSVSRCIACGLAEVAIHKLEELHRAIASALLHKPALLAAGEIRFLRKQLGWSGAELANHLGVTRETVSRWEQGAAPMGGTADRLLRATVALATPISFRTETLRQIGRGQGAPVQLRLSFDEKHGWKSQSHGDKPKHARHAANL